MKRIIATITATIVALGLTAIAAAPAQAYSDRDRAFVRAVRHDAWEARAVSARVLIKIARTTCTAVRSGVDPLDVVYSAMDAGLEQNTGVVLTAASIAFYCPDMGYLFDDGPGA